MNVDPLNAKVTFDTQGQILDEVSKHSWWLRFMPPLGYCSAFSNMCAEARMKGILPAFLNESTYNEIYQTAKRVDQVQKRAIKQGEDGEHLAFLNKKYEVKELRTVPAQEDVLRQMGRFNLVTYPLSRLQKHQIYFEKDGDTCKLFNADEPGGLRTGPCGPLMDSLSQSMFYYLDKFSAYDKDAKVTVASSNG